MKSVDVAGHSIGAPSFLVAAGPCSITEREQTLRVAKQVRAAGAGMFRGGAFKPRTSPDAFQGLGRAALDILAEVGDATGLPIVTELLDVRDLEAVLAVADMVQVGARNMHNTPLLKELGRAGCPVLLKRGFAATIDETVEAARYITREGNDRIVLCERGIRTFETSTRFILDLAAVPLLKERSGFPVIVDPSHAVGRRDLVPAMSKAAVAAGADGLIVEVDEDPERALSDPAQQLYAADFPEYMEAIRRLVELEDRQLLEPSPRASASPEFGKASAAG
jgi:3-deoxy-7-phosphoheptulonate synthase